MISRYQRAVEIHTREDERQLEADVAEVLSTAAGRRLLMAALGKSGVYAKSRPGSLEYDAGRRDCGLELLHISNRHALEHVEQAQRERNELLRRRNDELARAREADEKERKGD